MIQRLGRKKNKNSCIVLLFSAGWVGLAPVAAHPASLKFSGTVHQRSSGEIYPQSGIVHTFINQAGLMLTKMNPGTQTEHVSFFVEDAAGRTINASIRPVSLTLAPNSQAKIRVIISMEMAARRAFRVCARSSTANGEASCGHYTAVRVY